MTRPSPRPAAALATAIAFALVATGTTSAQAPVIYQNEDAAAPRQGTIYGTLGIGGSSAEATSHSLLVVGMGGRVLAGRSLALTFDWALVNSSYDIEGPGAAARDDELVLANPTLGAHGLFPIGLGIVDVGIELTPPVNDLDDWSIAALGASTGALGMLGMWNAWMWTPSMFTFSIPARVVLDLLIASVGAEGAVATMIATSDRYADSVEFIVQAAGFAAVNVGPSQIGLRLQLVSIVSADSYLGTHDATQIALGPTLRLAFGPAFFSGYLHVNVDEPYGFAFEDSKYWGLHLSGGGAF